MVKRILFCINSLEGGGAERVVLNLAKEFLKIGHYVHLLVLDESNEYGPDFDIPIDTLYYKKRGKNNAKALRLLIEDLEEKEKFDLILSHLPRTDKLVSSLKHKNIYFCIHTTFSKAYIDNKSFFKSLRRKIRYQLRYNGKNIIAVSNGAASDFVHNMKILPKTIRTIYNPFNFKEIREKAIENNLLKNEKYIISVANFGHVKRHDILLKAYKEAGVDYKLVLVGKNLKDNLSSLVQELGLENKVIFMGFLSNPYPLIKGAKVLVLSSEFEGLGNVLVEALVLGTNVISTDCDSGPREVLTDKLSSNLVPVNDIHTLASKISEIVESENIIVDFTMHINKFSASHVAQEYLKLIKD